MKRTVMDMEAQTERKRGSEALHHQEGMGIVQAYTDVRRAEEEAGREERAERGIGETAERGGGGGVTQTDIETEAGKESETVREKEDTEGSTMHDNKQRRANEPACHDP